MPARPDIEDRQHALDEAFLTAASQLDLRRVQELLDCGARATAQDRSGNTALHFMTMGKRVPKESFEELVEPVYQMVRQLVQKGLDLRAENALGLTALGHMVTNCRHRELAPSLVGMAILRQDPSLLRWKTRHGRPLAERVMVCEFAPMLAYILENGGTVKPCPGMLSIETPEVLRLILEAGVNVDARVSGHSSLREEMLGRARQDACRKAFEAWLVESEVKKLGEVVDGVAPSVEHRVRARM